MGVIPRPVFAGGDVVVIGGGAGAETRGGVFVSDIGSDVTGVSNFLTMIDLSSTAGGGSISIGVSDVEIGSTFVPEVTVVVVAVSVGGTEVSANNNCSLVIFKSSAGVFTFSTGATTIRF